MTIKDTGRRGLFGLLLGAPVAIVTVAAKATQPSEVAVTIVNKTGGVWSLGDLGGESIMPLQRNPDGRLEIEVIVDEIELKMASRISRGGGILGNTIEAVYGAQRVGR